MCGIAGILSKTIVGDSCRTALIQMTDAMSHRGPNGSGIHVENHCGLGHTRLAVIDTSMAGAQPMMRDGVTLVYNGELYNFQEEKKFLEAEGFSFLGHSDAEVLLTLYLRYGEGCVQHIQGMYAFAIWDSCEQKLFCARDPLGIKPFLYAETSEGFIFSSELKALLASGLVNKDIDRASLRALLEHGSIPQPDSILQGVKWLLPGFTLKLQHGKPPVLNCFRPFLVGAIDLTGEDWPSLVKHGESLLGSVLRHQTVADVPLGAFLSGGIDSSLLVALMAREHHDLRAFSVGFEGGLETDSEDETNDAEMVARHLGINYTRIIVQQRDIYENLRAIARGLDHPTVDGVNSWFVAKAASQELTVAISGTGGDELFAGYPWFGAMQEFVQRPWKERMIGYYRKETFNSTFDAQYRIFDVLAASALCPRTRSPAPRPDPLNQAGTFSRVTGMLLSGYTRDQLLADIDTAAMSHGLEVRVPLLDENLLDFALALPETAKMTSGNPLAPHGSYAASGTKRLLLEIGLPLLPNGFAYRAKKGFTLPIDSWLRGMLLPIMKDILSTETTAKRGFFEPVAVQQVLYAFLAGKVHWTRPWLLMMTELWAQEVLDA
ncbi:MAG: asparagine synthase (glutamine-hydrolyzing) [Thiothrix sp.]|uniref:asparagine synthase (glutamine-hydrolyzing) n=1 Tax=Thiothrix sp. TaxID=1032 RepID=UPI00260DCEAD|nr:asparagine synthase (glutamine-hydrolyzing) [Thiothrix sp.]MDD5394684.1 asparagine synthase (glutamine-hydrolyzing) [Thiothrix sp.]